MGFAYSYAMKPEILWCFSKIYSLLKVFHSTLHHCVRHTAMCLDSLRDLHRPKCLPIHILDFHKKPFC